MLALAAECGVNAAQGRLRAVGDKDVLLVRRFDRERTEHGYRRARMVSALTLLLADDGVTARGRWAYPLLADEVRRASADPESYLRELFTRMCFNAAISNLDDHPRNHAMIAWEHGWRLSPAYDLVPSPVLAQERRDLAMVCGKFGRFASSLREDALATANAHALKPLADWLTCATQRVDSFNSDHWEALRREMPRSSAQAPYERGYDLARAARVQLQPSALRYAFPTTGAEAIPHVTMQPPTAGIQGLVAARSPGCVVANGRATTQRFLLARALGDYLGRTTDAPAILSGLATDRQAQSRAFAAEFLAPAEALRQRLGGEQVSPDEVEDLACDFDVSGYVVRHQIENHNLAQIADW